MKKLLAIVLVLTLAKKWGSAIRLKNWNSVSSLLQFKMALSALKFAACWDSIPLIWIKNVTGKHEKGR